MKRKKKNKKPNNIFVTTAALSTFAIVVVFILAPVLLRGSVIRNGLHWFLLPLGSVDNKRAYIETIGAILGSFLAVTGAVWTQHKLEGREEKEKIRMSAYILHQDLEYALKQVQNIAEYMNDKTDMEFDTERHNKDFTEAKLQYPFSVPIDWRNKVAEIRKALDAAECENLLKVCQGLEVIYTRVGKEDFKSNEQAFTMLKDFVSVTYSNAGTNITNSICCIEKYQGLLNKLKQLAGLNDTIKHE